MKKILVHLVFISACTLCASAVLPDFQKDALGVVFTHDGIVTRVDVWGERIIRVTHKPAASGNTASSLTVVSKPERVSWTLAEERGDIVLTTPALRVHIAKSSGAVRFLNDRDATILCETVKGTSLQPATIGSAKETLAVRQQFVLDPAEAIYGLGQHQDGVMNYVGTSVHLQQKNTMVAVPVLLSSKGYAVLWDNPAVTDVDAGKTDRGVLAWSSEAGAAVDYYFAYGPEPDRAIAGYRTLTGAVPLFGKWAWGLWQSRERYASQQELLGVASEYRKRQVPFDGLVQDWQYWAPLKQETAEGGWGSHAFEKSRYPDPVAMMKTLHDEHVHLIISVWAKFEVTKSGTSIPNLQHLEAVGGAYDPAIPFAFPKGLGKWYDPFNEKARSVYWKDISQQLFSLGVDGWWLDASEAELSGKWGEFRNFTTAKGSGASVFNAYPLEHTRAVYEGQRGESRDKRVFILTRSAYAGQQRNAAVTWSGDIKGTWDVFKKQIPAGLNFCASGIPYWNTDIGGFFGGDPDDPKYAELFTRWFEFGAFNSMFRIHGTGKPKEIWRWNEATQAAMKDVIDLRYHLMPYIYSVSWMVTHGGYTMMRPLVMDFARDAKVYGIADQFMFGPAFLVNPVTQAGVQTRQVYLPSGTKWTDFWTGDTLDGGRTVEAAAPTGHIPLYVRAGSIIPYGPAIQFADAKADPIELRIYPGANCAFTLYEDEGDNYDYEKGIHATILVRWDEKKKQLTIGARQGEFPGMLKNRTFRIVLVKSGHGNGIASFEKADASVQYNGTEVTIPLPGT